MNTFFVKNSQLHSGIAKVTGDDYHHLKNVLRLKVGEEAYICDEDGNKFVSKLFEIRDDMAVFDVLEKLDSNYELPVNITLYQGLPKQDKLEKVIKETTQLGIFEVIPTIMEYSVAKLEAKDETKKLDRWNKIAKEAAKQCGRQKIPKVLNPIKFKNIIENLGKYDIVLLLYEGEKDQSLKSVLTSAKEANININNIAIVVGPEGGLSVEEVNELMALENVHVCTLGKRILRTELAPIVVMSNLIYEFDD